jgi:hypothetical protein
VKTPFASKSLSQAARRRVELAIAVAQERLLNTHVDHALDLIELVGDQVPFDDALDIYHRLLRISEDEARIITTRALATLGEHDDAPKGWPERMAEADLAATSEAPSGSLLQNLRQRLRGRINEDLRRWIELEAARTEVALIDAHVANALNFVALLEGELPFTEATELYLEALEVRDSIAEVVYYITLARLNARLLPPRRQRGGTPALANAPEERHLRVVEQDGA